MYPFHTFVDMCGCMLGMEGLKQEGLNGLGWALSERRALKLEKENVGALPKLHEKSNQREEGGRRRRIRYSKKLKWISLRKTFSEKIPTTIKMGPTLLPAPPLPPHPLPPPLLRRLPPLHPTPAMAVAPTPAPPPEAPAAAAEPMKTTITMKTIRANPMPIIMIMKNTKTKIYLVLIMKITVKPLLKVLTPFLVKFPSFFFYHSNICAAKFFFTYCLADNYGYYLMKRSVSEKWFKLVLLLTYEQSLFR